MGQGRSTGEGERRKDECGVRMIGMFSSENHCDFCEADHRVGKLREVRVSTGNVIVDGDTFD